MLTKSYDLFIFDYLANDRCYKNDMEAFINEYNVKEFTQDFSNKQIRQFEDILLSLKCLTEIEAFKSGIRLQNHINKRRDGTNE